MTNSSELTISCFAVVVIITVNMTAIRGNQSDDRYVDSVINALLNGDSIELENDGAGLDFTDEQVEQPIYEDGTWKCGNCDVINENNLIYTEVYNIETNDLDEVPYEVQVGASVAGMQCVSVTADAASRSAAGTRVVDGACAAGRVMLAVRAEGGFTVQVYGTHPGFGNKSGTSRGVK